MKCLSILLLAALSLPVMVRATDWSDALRDVATGEIQWLEQVPALAAVADVKQARILEDSLAVVLTADTTDALRALDALGVGHWPHMIGSDIVYIPSTKAPNKVNTFCQWTRQALLSTAAGVKCLWIPEASYDKLETDNVHRTK